MNNIFKKNRIRFFIFIIVLFSFYSISFSWWWNKNEKKMDDLELMKTQQAKNLFKQLTEQMQKNIELMEKKEEALMQKKEKENERFYNRTIFEKIQDKAVVVKNQLKDWQEYFDKYELENFKKNNKNNSKEKFDNRRLEEKFYNRLEAIFPAWKDFRSENEEKSFIEYEKKAAKQRYENQ